MMCETLNLHVAELGQHWILGTLNRRCALQKSVRSKINRVISVEDTRSFEAKGNLEDG
jgi:hypothetical protein